MQVSIMLPYPLEKCVTYPILLPRISCTQVEDKKCMAVPRVREGLLLTVNKCSVTFGDPECSETVLTLPRQGCPSKVVFRIRILYFIQHIFVSRWRISRTSMSMLRKLVTVCLDKEVILIYQEPFFSRIWANLSIFCDSIIFIQAYLSKFWIYQYTIGQISCSLLHICGW